MQEKPKSHILSSILVFILSTHTPLAYSLPESRCNFLITPLYLDKFFIFHPDTYKAIRAHPISELVKELEKKGVVLNFSSVELNRAELLGQWIGESVQTKSLARLIGEIFHESKFAYKKEWEAPDSNLIPLTIVDSDEGAQETGPRIPTDRLEMSLLKAANPLIPIESKFIAKSNLFLKIDSDVFSIYSVRLGTSPFRVSLSTIEDLIIKTSAYFNSRYIFVSFSPSDSTEALEVLYANRKRILEKTGYRVIFASDLELLDQDPKNSDQKYILLNNSFGRMREIYAASDYAAVIGPNNIFEPIQQNIPTLIYATSDFLYPYSPQTFDRMVTIALATNGAVLARTEDKLSNAYQKLKEINRENIKFPAFIQIDGHPSSFDLLLDELEMNIRKRLVR